MKNNNTTNTARPAVDISAILAEPMQYTDKSGTAHTLPALWDPARKRCTYDNDKTGIISINLLAGDMSEPVRAYVPECLQDIAEAVQICGTCDGTCPGCYALKMVRYMGVYVKFMLNTAEAKTDPERFFYMVERELFGNPFTAPRVARVHDSGDFFGADYFRACMDFIKRNAGTRFGGYSKAENIIKTAGRESLPDNYCLNWSPWPGVCGPLWDLPQFWYDNHTDPAIMAMRHCPAVDKHGRRTGVKCIDCLHCYTARPGDVIAVHAH